MDTNASTVPIAAGSRSQRSGIVIGRKLRIPASALTLHGFRAWAHSPRFPARGKATFIAGEVFLEMSPEEIRTHNSPKRDIFGYLWNYSRQMQLGQLFADRALLVHEAAGLSTEPDIMFCRWETLDQGRATLREIQKGSGRFVELHGAPDLVIEIVSRTSQKKDTVDLRAAYHRAQIPEYWIVDARGDEIVFQLLHWQPAEYVEASRDAAGLRPSQTLGAKVSLSRDRDRIGGWQYTLYIA